MSGDDWAVSCRVMCVVKTRGTHYKEFRREQSIIYNGVKSLPNKCGFKTVKLMAIRVKVDNIY